MVNFFAELKRRQMFRVAAAYAVVAWVLLQVVNNLAPALMLPNWAATLVLVLLVIGFPVALLFCWIQQLAPTGGDSKTTTGKLDWVLVGALVSVIALVSYEQLTMTSVTTSQQQPGVEAARVAAASPLGAVSVAVLPFANMSGDPTQEFFSDGMTEEITSALAKIPDLRVVGRTSAFQFRDERKDLRVIGQSLSATHLIEGSVRKAGERVRVTVQLIQASDGTHLWTESYDRELTDIFAIQEDIGRAIAASLRMPLGLRPGESLVSNRTQDLATYQDYLQGRAWLRARLSPRSGPYIETLESVVARDPGFAPAWALLARAYSLRPGENGAVLAGPIEGARQFVASWLDKAEAAGRRAIELDPQSSDAYGGLAYTQGMRGRWAESEDFAKRATELDPNDAEALHLYSQALFRTGRINGSLKIRQTLQILDALSPTYNVTTAAVIQASGKTEAAIEMLEQMPSGALRDTFLARAYAGARRYGEAADTLLVFRPANPVTRQRREDIARVVRALPSASLPQELETQVTFSELNFIFAHMGMLDRMMVYPERELANRYMQDFHKFMWLPELSALRKTERFKAFAHNAGLVEYWRTRGWPDLCKPAGADDFACE